MGLSRERVRQIEREALHRLREHSGIRDNLLEGPRPDVPVDIHGDIRRELRGDRAGFAGVYAADYMGGFGADLGGDGGNVRRLALGARPDRHEPEAIDQSAK
jgi:hypothetical protein